MEAVCTAPSEEELLAAFAVVPHDRRSADGYWAYVFEDDAGVSIRLSFDTHERSVQTVVMLAGAVITTVSHEDASRIAIDPSKQAIVADLGPASAPVRMQLRVAPRLELTWTGLRRRS